MKIEIADYVETTDGGAVVVFEMDEDARKGLITEAIKRRIIEGLELMPEINYASPEDSPIDIEDYIADMETRKRLDSVEPAPKPSDLFGMGKDEGEAT